jgi:hypothetical protein
MKVGHVVQGYKWEKTQTGVCIHTHKQHGDLMSLLSFVKKGKQDKHMY